MNTKPLFLLLISLFFSSIVAHAQLERFPFRIPDWLWKSESTAPFLNKAFKAKIDSLVLQMDNSYAQNNNKLGDSLELAINQLLGKRFSLLDLSSGADIVRSRDLVTALQLDPIFTPESKQILRNALAIFLRLAFDDEVISQAMSNSALYPKPMPEMYDSAGDYTSEYVYFRKCRTKPSDVETFKKQLRAALTTANGDPALFVATSHVNMVWWGYAYLNFYYIPSVRLCRLSPEQNFIYISFNRDSLAQNLSPIFWASKFAHETLHNLGYYHPTYKNVAERDSLNKGKEKTFIVAYEFAILDKAKKIFKGKYQ